MNRGCKICYRFFTLWLAHQTTKVGGQAIIEGVMMRSSHSFSMAVRRKNQEIICKHEPYISLTQRKKWLGWPFMRGFIQLVESVLLGLKALRFSADIATEDERISEENTVKKGPMDTVFIGATVLVSFGIALLVFMYLPLVISSLIKKDQNPFLFNAIAGSVRITFFLLYLWLISLWKDVRRVFEYHGAEHKSVFLYEAGEKLTIENAKQYTTHHPRCGTSFLLIVALVCVLIFAVIDGLVAITVGPYPSLVARFLVHCTLIPIVSGASYEILRLSDRRKSSPIVAVLIQPGLWLQKITTREPDESQLEVALTALKAVI
jgi:uncharacterized protein YqhQ